MTAWKEISEIQEWNDLFAHSDEQPFVILKHSTT